jgi:hypothetical protein
MKYFFVDTNLFLQCRDISDLPWDEVSNAKHVRLIIPRAVQNEIDKLKADGNSRRAKRARNTNSYFRQIILSDGEQLQVKNTSHANVILTFSSHVAASPGDVPDVALDSARPDDSILLEVISYRALYPDHDVALLTHDTNPLLTAKRLKIPFQIIPDGWLLSPEPDEREKEIRNLKTRITEIENTHPKIEFTFGKEGVSVPNKICADIVIYPPFSQAEINTLIEQIKIEYPLEQSFDEKLKNQLHSNSPFATPAITLASLQFGKSYKQPTAEEINKYKNVDYPNWLRKIERKLIELPDFLSVHNNKIGVVIALENIGNSPAEHAIFRVETSSGILIAPPIDEDDEDMSKNWKFINPPSPPRGKYRDISELYGVNAASLLMRDFEPLISPLVQPRSRDRHRFYWKPKRPSLPQALCELECEEFIHKDVPEKFHLNLLTLQGAAPSSGAISFTVMAKNLPHPASITIPLKISYSKESSMDEARRLCGLPFVD